MSAKFYNTLGISDHSSYEDYVKSSEAEGKIPVDRSHYDRINNGGDTSVSEEGETTVTVDTNQTPVSAEASSTTTGFGSPTLSVDLLSPPTSGGRKNKVKTSPDPEAPALPGQKAAVEHHDKEPCRPPKRSRAQAAEDAVQGRLIENTPEFNKASGERVVHGQNNTWIVFGRDRPGSPQSGYAGKQHTHSGAIDIVVGRMGHLAKGFNEKCEPIAVDNDFIRDAARIYIAQKTDVDRNFGIATDGSDDGNIKSAIALKADHIRIISREGIKLVTRTDDKNSQGGDIKSTGGITMQAGNDASTLQPMVKGENLKEAIERLVHHVDKLNGIVMGLVATQMQFNSAVATHVHLSPAVPGAPTMVAPAVVAAGAETLVKLMKDTTRSLMTHKANLQIYKAKYLTPVSDCWILSRHNKAN